MVDRNDGEEGVLWPFSYEELSRREIRSLILHLLYAMDAFDYQISLEELIDNFNRGFHLNIPIDSDFVKVTQAVIEQRHKLDEKIRPLLINWRFERIGVCTRLILRLALWELLNRNTAPSIVINEAIELAKCFSETDAYKFVNGILDELVKNMKKRDND
jgi:N utilization substance protein B